MIRNEVCGLRQTVSTGGYGEEMGFGNGKNKSRLSVSTAQVQTPAAVAGGDALAGRVVERPPQRKTRRALSLFTNRTVYANELRLRKYITSPDTPPYGEPRPLPGRQIYPSHSFSMGATQSFCSTSPW
ncbi:hypothetical protein QQF64_022661 [Cirrhinus molitorella]|uniref:Uncharacterized protein n=1 Tax=Cirrhinus molitorella TaxID=172907 RepID=A0ABR3L4F3_9TELE